MLLSLTLASAGELGPESYKPNKHGGRGGAAEESKIIIMIIIMIIVIITITTIIIIITLLITAHGGDYLASQNSENQILQNRS